MSDLQWKTFKEYNFSGVGTETHLFLIYKSYSGRMSFYLLKDARSVVYSPLLNFNFLKTPHVKIFGHLLLMNHVQARVADSLVTNLVCIFVVLFRINRKTTFLMGY